MWIIDNIGFYNIFVCNSTGSSHQEQAALKALEPFLVSLPYFFNLVGFYNDQTNINFASGLYVGKSNTDPLDVHLVPGLPQQKYCWG